MKFKQWLESGEVSRGGAPAGRPEGGHWPRAAEVKPKPLSLPTQRKRAKQVVADDPEAIRLADEAYKRHQERIRGATEPEQIQNSYEMFNQELAQMGIVPTETGYGFKP